MQSRSNSSDVTILGGGPSGLAAAITFARRGLKTILHEKNENIGDNPRGETIRPDSRIDKLLGEGFLENQKLHQVKLRTYYSGSGKKLAHREISTWNYIIDWQKFLQAMATVAQKAGVEIRTSSEVESFKQLNKNQVHVKAANQDYLTSLIVDCRGARNSQSLQERQKLPVLKQIVKNFGGESNRFHYFFHPSKKLPMIASIFPRADREAEILTMGLTDSVRHPDSYLRSLLDTTKLQDMQTTHSAFRSVLEGSEVIYERTALLPMSAPGTDFFNNGIFQSGDNIGLVESRGGSGIKSSIVISQLLAEQIADHWPNAASQGPQISKSIQSSKAYQDLVRMNKLFGVSRRALFGLITSAKQMDFYWPLLKLFLR